MRENNRTETTQKIKDNDEAPDYDGAEPHRLGGILGN
jgi:hypothetical protein